MPLRPDLKKVLLIGSGPIVIGQACEFDYSGTQACRVLKREGIEVVLVNSNPATIMTDPDVADRTYVEPLTAPILERIIERERPDALLPTVGGQTGLNLAVELAEKRHPREVRRRADRRLARGDPDRRGPRPLQGRVRARRRRDAALGQGALVGRRRGAGRAARLPAGRARVVHARRPGLGRGQEPGRAARGGRRIGIEASPVGMVLVEECLTGWSEFELEVMRDRKDNVVIVCSIENFDPMGVHTGDSITVAPAQTLSDRCYQEMRDAAQRIIREIKVEAGGSNIQFAVDPAQRPHGRDRDEPARLAQLGAGVQGDRLPDRQDRRAARGRLHARRDPERHHARHARVLRAGARLLRGQDPALGVREVPRHRSRAGHPHEVGRRGHGDRPHVPRGAAEGPALARAGRHRDGGRGRRGPGPPRGRPARRCASIASGRTGSGCSSCSPRSPSATRPRSCPRRPASIPGSCTR